MSSIYEEITETVVAMLKDGTPPWRQSWITTGCPHPRHMPINAETKRPYRGINVPLLWLSQEKNKYKTPYWGTKATWKRLGAQILKHHLPTRIYLYRRGVKKTLLANFEVYNLDQVYGCFSMRPPDAPEQELTEEEIDFTPAENLVRKVGANIVHRAGVIPIYKISLDTIFLPPKKSFISRIGYWTTLWHEHVHWTGALFRLKRKFGKSPQSPEYAFEELVAELGTCFVCATLGIPEASHEMPQHVSYMKTWLQLLRNDEKAIFKAANEATKATDYLFNRGKIIEPEEDE